MRRVRLSHQAQADLDDIWLYVARDRSPEAADNVIDAITERFLPIAQMPAAGRRRDDPVTGVRSFPVGEYVIYYTRHRSNIVILRVLHGARDVLTAFRKP